MNYITSSKVTAQMYAPGGLQLGGVYDTTTTPVADIVTTFGSANITALYQAITQLTPDNRNTIATTQRTVYSTERATLNGRDYSRITRATEAFLRDPIYGRITASAQPSVRTVLTSSLVVEIEPERQNSQAAVIRELYTVSASAASTSSAELLRKSLPLDEYLQHTKTSENFKRTLYQVNETPAVITFLNAQWGKATDALEASDNDYADNTKFISGSTVYDDSNFTTPYNPSPGYHKIKGQLAAYQIWPSGKVIDYATGADKDSQAEFAAFMDINMDGYDDQDSLKEATLDESVRASLYFFGGQFYRDEYLGRPFNGNSKWYHNYELNEYTRIDSNGQPLQSEPIS